MQSGLLTNWRQRLTRHIAEAELRSPFEPMAWVVYLVIAFFAVVATPLLILRGFTFDPRVWLTVGLWPFLVTGGLMLRRLGALRGATALETIGLVHAQGFAFIWLFFAVAIYSGPLTDAALSRWDEALGFSWLDFWERVQPHMPVLRQAYRSFAWQPILMLLTLAWLGLHRTAWIFVSAASLSLATALGLFLIFPAKAAMIHYGAGTEYAGTAFLAPLEYLREGGNHITPDLFQGYVTFPSYHATCGAILIWAAWTTVLRWPIMTLNVLLIISAIPVGGHYLVDVLGGVALAIVAIWLAKWLVPQDRAKGLPA
jgi:membrane-associated phospholipid phosphatase